METRFLMSSTLCNTFVRALRLLLFLASIGHVIEEVF